MKFAVTLCLIALAVSVSADCTYKGKTYKTDESWQPEGVCMQQTCKGDNEIIGKGCALSAVANPSEFNYIEEDPKKKYPDCCPRYEKKA